MKSSQDDEVILEDLVAEIAKSQAVSRRERWEGADDDMGLTILTTLNKIGHSAIELPGVRTGILNMLKSGEISVRHILNGVPPAQVSDVSDLERWYMSQADANKVRALLLPETQTSPTAVEQAQTATGGEPTDTKQDALAVELDEILQAMQKNGERITATVVFAKLKKDSGKGGCVVDVAANGSCLQWERTSGQQENIDIKGLQKRIGRWKEKHPQNTRQAR